MQNIVRIQRALWSLGLILSSIACSSAPKFHLPPTAEVTLTHGDGKVGSYVSSWPGFRTSSYWIEGKDGLILIDTQFLLSAAEEMVNWAEKVTGKKAVLAIVLHSNPDKFNGTAFFQKRGIRVITSAQVLERIPAVHRLRVGWFYERFKPDYPSAEPKPESFGSQTQEISAAGLTVKAHVLGAGCSDAHVVVEHEGHFFVGDLVTQGFHSWLELGLLDEWLKRLDEIQALRPKHIHTGRGGSGDPDLLDRERQYLTTVMESVRRRAPRDGKPLTDEAAEEILAEIQARYPSYDYPTFIENGLPATWKRMGIPMKRVPKPLSPSR